jgi:hypothetical protein
MLFTQAQNEFKLLQDKALQGEPLILEPGYLEEYALWSTENAAILPKLSSEERTVSFSDHVEDSVLEEEKKIIETTEKDPDKKKKLINQAQRGQLLLTSTDEGKTFDKLLNVHEAQKIGPLTLHFKSPTLRSSTNNVEEVAEEQSMLHAVRKLRQQHFLVESAYVQDHVVHIDAIHPRRGNYEVQVKLDQDPTSPFEYAFLNQLGVQHVEETQLSNEYGEAAPDASLQKPDLGEIALRMMTKQGTEQTGQEALKKKAVLSSLFSHLALQEAKKHATSALERGAMAAEQTRLQMQSPATSNVMASKAAMGARKARQETQITGEKERMAEREEKYKAASKTAHEKQVEDEKNKTQKQRTLNSQFRKTMAVGGTAAAGVLAGAGSLSFMLAHLAHS